MNGGVEGGKHRLRYLHVVYVASVIGFERCLCRVALDKTMSEPINLSLT